MNRERIEAGLDALARVAQASKALSGKVAEVASRYAGVLRGGGTLFFCGNGGSAADPHPAELDAPDQGISRERRMSLEHVEHGLESLADTVLAAKQLGPT